MSSEKTYEEFAWKSPGDELKSARSHAVKATICCIIMFVIVCSQSLHSWQQTHNEYALSRENENLRLRLGAEQHQRRTLEATLSALEAKP